MRSFLSIFFFLSCLTLLLAASACTDYERSGINARPFNEPSTWENNPYGPNAFRN